jgi:hypothetical protein
MDCIRDSGRSEGNRLPARDGSRIKRANQAGEVSAQERCTKEISMRANGMDCRRKEAVGVG